MAGKIIIDTERCKGCGLCVVVCPNDCIVISKKSNKTGYFPAQANNTDCTGCAACAIICPDVVIEVYRDDTDNMKLKGKTNLEAQNTKQYRITKIQMTKMTRKYHSEA